MPIWFGYVQLHSYTGVAYDRQQRLVAFCLADEGLHHDEIWAGGAPNEMFLEISNADR